MFTAAFLSAVNHVMLYEVGSNFKLTDSVRKGLIDTLQNRKACGYTNDPVDPGGETKFGIAKNANLNVDVTRLTWDQAINIYYDKYWLAGSCDKLPSRVAALHFDACVNNGISRANKMLQAAIGVTQDGDIGPITIQQVSKMNDIVLCEKLCDARLSFYKNIVSNNPSQVKYINGWTRRVEEMRTFVKTAKF